MGRQKNAALQYAAVFHGMTTYLRGGDTMRFPVDPQPRLASTAIADVELNLDCRDEIIPILRALQHIYGEAACARTS